MAQRAYWKGSLKLSLVSCPVVLYPASTAVEKTRFHMINKETGNRLKQQMVDAETGDVVESDQKGRGYELLFVLGWATQSWGNAAGLFDLNQCTHIRLGKSNHVCLGYDNFVHFLIPLTSIGPIYVLGLRLGVLPDISKETTGRRRLGTVLFAVLGVMAIEYVNEIWEYIAVNWLNLNLQIGYSDTIHDLALGILGSVAGGVLLWVWAARLWTTERKPIT